MKQKKTGLIRLDERLAEDEELRELWERLPEQAQREWREIDEGKRVPNLLSDTVFKKIFDPDENKERLSRFLCSVLGRQVKVLHSLKNEGIRRSIHSKGIILDIVAQFEDGALANVEVQRQGIDFPSQRSAVYSADLVARQFAVMPGEKKGDMDYTDIQPVYTVILMEKSTGVLKQSEEYIHHFCQRSNEGLVLEHLQYYDYICLDKFRDNCPRTAGELEKWLQFLSIQRPEEMEVFLEENKGFQSIYDCATMMLQDRKGMMEMFMDMLEQEDIVASLNRTNESIIKKQKEEIRNWEKKSKRQESQLAQRESQLRQQDQEIRRLREELRRSRGN